MTKLMRGKLIGIGAACLLVASLVVAGATAPATTQALAGPQALVGPSVSIDPASQTVAPGASSSVDVVVDSSAYNLQACHVEVSYNSTIFTNVVVQEKGLLGTAILVEPGSAVTDGLVKYGVSRIAGNEAVPVSGTFITISFTISGTATGSYTLDVRDSVLIDETVTAIPGVEENDGVVNTGIPGVGPSVSIDPASQTVAPGASSSVDVVVDSNTYNLQACRVEVSYNSTIFTDVVVEEKGLLGTGILVEPGSGVTDGLVKYGVSRIAGNEPVPVSGTFITISFTVSAAATGSYTLDVRNTVLIDATFADIPGVVENDGEIVIGVPGPVVFDETFSDFLAEGERDFICTIPAGATELAIDLSTAASPGPDLDLELYDGATKVIGEFGVIDSAPDGTYDGDYFRYSGYDGGEEEITADSVTRPYDLMVYAYEEGTYTVDVYYVIPSGVDVTPPEIDIDAPDGTVGVPVTITVSATDPSGVAFVWFGVWDDDYVLTGTEADWYEAIANAGGPGGEVILTFTPSLADGYYVAAWAGDTVGNWTPDLAPETVDWEVT